MIKQGNLKPPYVQKTGQGRLSVNGPNYDQYFINLDIMAKMLETTKRVLNQLSPQLSPTHIIDPCCGQANYADEIRKLWPNAHLTFSDIDPKKPSIEQRDFIHNPHYTRRQRGKQILVIANPPFGGLHMSDAFLYNTFRFASAAAFLVPDIYRKPERGQALADDPLWRVVYEEKLPENIFTVNGKPFAWKCILQIWIYNDSMILHSNQFHSNQFHSNQLHSNQLHSGPIEPLGFQLIRNNPHHTDMWVLWRGRDAGTILEPGTKGRSKNSKWGIKLNVDWLMEKYSVKKTNTKLRQQIRGKMRDIFRHTVNNEMKNHEMEAFGSRNCLDYKRTVAALNTVMSQIKIIKN